MYKFTNKETGEIKYGELNEISNPVTLIDGEEVSIHDKNADGSVLINDKYDIEAVIAEDIAITQEDLDTRKLKSYDGQTVTDSGIKNIDGFDFWYLILEDGSEVHLTHPDYCNALRNEPK